MNASRVSKPLILLTALGFAVGCGSSASNTAEENSATENNNTDPAPELSPAPADLVGVWKSACFNPGNGFTQITFDLTETSWDLDYTAFGDEACEVPFLTVNIKGPYELLGASSAVEGAREGNFGFGERTVTPHMEAAIEVISEACGGGEYAVGEATDISGGCAGLGAYPHDQCPTDHDIVKLDGNSLMFGQRPADNNMCTEDTRPTALGLTVTRQ